MSLNEFAMAISGASQDFPLWQPVLAEGACQNEKQFLLDSQVFQGKPGYHVICPFKLGQSDWIVLVNRGWLAAGSDRQKLPLIPPMDATEIKGQMSKLKTAMPGFEYAENPENKIHLFINIEQLSAQIGAPILPMMLLLDEYAADSLDRDWPEFEPKIKMHQFYVAHWLIVALVSILVYLYFAFKEKSAEPESR